MARFYQGKFSYKYENFQRYFKNGVDVLKLYKLVNKIFKNFCNCFRELKVPNKYYQGFKRRLHLHISFPFFSSTEMKNIMEANQNGKSGKTLR